MALKPTTGDVVRYDLLWAEENHRGQFEGDHSAALVCGGDAGAHRTAAVAP